MTADVVSNKPASGICYLVPGTLAEFRRKWRPAPGSTRDYEGRYMVERVPDDELPAKMWNETE